jgi:hypothetical protein
MVFLCRSVAELQRDLGTQASPSRTRSPKPRGATQSLVDDVRMTTLPPSADKRVATLPPTTDSRTATPPRGDEVGAGGTLEDVGTSASLRVIDMDPISTRPRLMEEDLVRDLA